MNSFDQRMDQCCKHIIFLFPMILQYLGVYTATAFFYYKNGRVVEKEIIKLPVAYLIVNLWIHPN
jgi:hypothetical protein